MVKKSFSNKLLKSARRVALRHYAWWLLFLSLLFLAWVLVCIGEMLRQAVVAAAGSASDSYHETREFTSYFSRSRFDRERLRDEWEGRTFLNDRRRS